MKENERGLHREGGEGVSHHPQQGSAFQCFPLYRHMKFSVARYRRRLERVGSGRRNDALLQPFMLVFAVIYAFPPTGEEAYHSLTHKNRLLLPP